MTVSQWADEYRMLPSDSPEPGRWKTSRVEHMRPVMDSFTDPKIRRIVVKSSAQVSKTECLLNVVGRFVMLDPCPILIVQPTLSDAEDFSKTRLGKMIQDSKALTPLFYEKARQHDPNQTILSKFFKGGRVLLCGSNSPSGLASRPIRILLCDEVDRYIPTKEGDAVDLAAKRTSNFFNSKIALFSTPTTEGISRIDAEYMFGTQEEWNHQCPNCGEWHTLKVENMTADYVEHKDAAGNKSVVVRSVKWRCPDCGLEFTEAQIKSTAQKYIALNPSATENGIRSFWVNGFSSAWLKWTDIMREWLEAQGDSTRESVVVNTRFGLSYQSIKKVVEESDLTERVEAYDGEIPDGVLCLTCGVDVQANRLAYQIVGFGANMEIWSIQYNELYGKPTEKNVWRKLDAALERTYRFKDGRTIKISRTFIDSGFATNEVYNYCKGTSRFPIKGLGSVGIPLIHKYTRLEDKGILLTILGVNDGKAQVFSRLEQMHFGRDDTLSRNFDRNYFKQLCSEHRVIKRLGGQLVEVYEKINRDARNEALDTLVYALAALYSLIGNSKPDKFFQKCFDNLRGEPKKITPVKAKIKQRTIDLWS